MTAASSPAIELSVIGASVWGDGLPGWAAAAAVLRGDASYVRAPAPLPPPMMLSPTERRRASPSVRLALAVGQEATAMAGCAADALRCVFATSNGDAEVVHAILETLATGDGQVSPTQFHNSVHNAAVGYWTIAGRSRQPATCLGCHDWTAATALLKAAAEAAVEQAPTLLCVYDAPVPPPLAAVRTTATAFAAALVLAPASHAAAPAFDAPALDAPACRLRLRWSPEAPPAGDDASPAWLARLAEENPAARLLPLLRAIARGSPQRLALPLLRGHVAIEASGCSDASRSPR